jgi:hypothetical protein
VPHGWCNSLCDLSDLEALEWYPVVVACLVTPEHPEPDACCRDGGVKTNLGKVKVLEMRQKLSRSLSKKKAVTEPSFTQNVPIGQMEPDEDGFVTLMVSEVSVNNKKNVGVWALGGCKQGGSGDEHHDDQGRKEYGSCDGMTVQCKDGSVMNQRVSQSVSL